MIRCPVVKATTCKNRSCAGKYPALWFKNTMQSRWLMPWLQFAGLRMQLHRSHKKMQTCRQNQTDPGWRSIRLLISNSTFLMECAVFVYILGRYFTVGAIDDTFSSIFVPIVWILVKIFKLFCACSVMDVKITAIAEWISTQISDTNGDVNIS